VSVTPRGASPPPGSSPRAPCNAFARLDQRRGPRGACVSSCGRGDWVSEWVAQGLLEHHPAPLLFVALLFMRGLAYIAAVAPARARHELAPLRAGVWIGDHLTGVGTGPLACAFAGWLAALLELVPAMSDERRIIHSAWLSLSVGSLFV
jgi:hypothetical protein